MITSYLFLKGIRTRIILPFQSNITLTVIKFNSSSSDSSSNSSSDSDSNSDSEISNKDSKNNKVFKTIEYLKNAKVKQKKRQIEKEITKAAQILTTTSTEDKEKVLLPLLNKIGNIQNADNTFTKSNIYKDAIKKENKINWGKENNIKYSIEKMKYQSQEKSFSFQNEQNMKKNINKFKTKYDATESNTPIKMYLKENRNKTKMTDNKFNTKFETKIDDIKDLKTSNTTSIIKLLRQKEKRNIDKLNISKTKMNKNFKDKILESNFKYLQEEDQNINKSDSKVKLKKFFDNLPENSDVPEFKMWNTWEKMELEFSIVKYPKNAFQEMIKWTKEGKLWKFPIDNEQGMEDEYNVHFSKHVFLENHLVPWCPSKGPIRHFMELVCVGLSKNPYMTIEEKYDHIMWYKNYFKDKQDLLQKLDIVE